MVWTLDNILINVKLFCNCISGDK